MEFQDIRTYIKKPVRIEAFHFSKKEVAYRIIDWFVDNTEELSYRYDEYFIDEGLHDDLRRSDEWIKHEGGWEVLDPKAPPFIVIPTLEGRMRADLGDYIIRGVDGEFYPCKPDIFWKSYVALESDDNG